jgi:hypothetical protein
VSNRFAPGRWSSWAGKQLDSQQIAEQVVEVVPERRAEIVQRRAQFEALEVQGEAEGVCCDPWGKVCNVPGAPS